MTYKELAGLLARLAEQIPQAERYLTGPPTVEKAKKLGTAAEGFEKMVAATLRGNDPAAQAFRARWSSPAVLECLTVKALPLIGTLLLKRRFAIKKGESVTAARERLADLVIQAGEAEVALTRLDQFVTPPPPVELDKEEELRNELLRLGALDEEAFDLEVSLKLSRETASALVKLAGLRLTRSGPSKKNLADLRTFARRLRENTLGWRS